MKCEHTNAVANPAKKIGFIHQTMTTKIKLVCPDCGAAGKKIIKHNTKFVQVFWDTTNHDAVWDGDVFEKLGVE
jgi:ssDNA-binding Zn-finger/Zn-ribbon topoisomerase 1